MSQKTKPKSFRIFQKFSKKRIYTWVSPPPPTPKFHNVLIVGTKVLKSNHISYTTAKPTQNHKYIQTRTPTISKTKPKTRKTKPKLKLRPQLKRKQNQTHIFTKTKN